MHIGISHIPHSKPHGPRWATARHGPPPWMIFAPDLEVFGSTPSLKAPFSGFDSRRQIFIKGVGAARVKASGNASPEARTAATYPRNSSSAKPAIHQTTAQPEKYSCNNHHSTSCDCRRNTGSGVLAPLCQRLPPQTNSAYNLGCRGHVSRGC